jgi:hypothetical protein
MKRKPQVSGTPLILLVSFLLVATAAHGEDLKPETLKAWNTYVDLTQQRIDKEINDGGKFLIRDFKDPAEAKKLRDLLKSGGVYIERMQTNSGSKKINVDGGIIHHWYGAIFIPNMTLPRLLRWVQDYDQHHRYFPEVKDSRRVSRDGDTFKIFLHLVRTKVITVHYDTWHTVTFQPHGATRTSSRSISTKILEIEDAGTPKQTAKPEGKDSGYFWRTNSYWRYQEEDGGVLVECESVSLSRGLPRVIGWLPGLKGFIESVPRESLDSMLTSIKKGASSPN